MGEDIFPSEPPEEFIPYISKLTMFGHPFKRLAIIIICGIKGQKIKHFTGTATVSYKFADTRGDDLMYSISFSKAEL